MSSGGYRVQLPMLTVHAKVARDPKVNQLLAVLNSVLDKLENNGVHVEGSELNREWEPTG